MWGENVVNFSISKVEVTKLQRYNLILVCTSCVYPLREVRSDQGILKISRYVVTVYNTTQRWYIGR